MEDSFDKLTGTLSRQVGEIRAARPELMRDFHALSASATAPGALEAKAKELIALAIGVATHCEGCIGFHTQKLAKLGASRDEVLDALGVCIYMGGGPSLMFAAEALRAFDEFSGGARD